MDLQLLGVLVAPIIGVLAVWLQDQVAQRDRAQRRRRAVVRATEEVAFLRAWLDAFQLVAGPEEQQRALMRAKAGLARSYDEMEQSARADVVEGREAELPTASVGGGRPQEIRPPQVRRSLWRRML